MLRTTTLGMVLATAVFAGGCAHLPPDDPSDPFETVNRGVFTFNRTADKYVLRPVAKSYDSYVPGEIRAGVRNALDNLFYPTVIINDLLQAKFVQSGKDLTRFVLNSTVGIAGIMDVATPIGLPKNNEDLGQTFGYWGAGEGWYLMVPFLGPSNSRDLLGSVGDAFTSPMGYLDTEPSIIIKGMDVVDNRSRLLNGDKFLDEQLDPYIFLRTAYLQRRQDRVFDGNPPKVEFDFDDD